jgi:hypothetical protein
MYLKNVNALTRNVTQNLVFLVEMAAKHLCGLVYSMFNLDRYTSAGLTLLDDLFIGKKCIRMRLYDEKVV